MLYDNILDVLNNYYGLDAMQKVYTRGVEIGLKGNTQWGRYYNQLAEMTPDIVKWQTKSGKSVGLWSIKGTQSVPTASLVPTTKNTLTTIDMAMGTEVGEYAGKQIPKLVTAGGTSGSTSIGSFVVGEVLPAIGAAACGVVLGVAVDKLLYKSNPDYWDEKLPTLNPETWDDIILGHDTKIPFLHNTENGKTYIKEDMLAYTSLLGSKEKWFSDSYDEKTDTNTRFNGYSCGVTTSVKCTVYQRDIPTGETQVINISDGYFVSFNDGTKSIDNIYIIHQKDKTPRVNFKFNDVNLHAYFEASNKADYTFNNMTAYATDMSLFSAYRDDETLDNNMYFASTSTPNTKRLPPCVYPKPVKEGWMGILSWIGLYGNTTQKHSDTPEGINTIGTVPNLNNVTTINDAISRLRETYPDLYNNAIDIPYYDVDTDTTTTNKWIPTTIPTDFVNTDDNIINKPNNKPVSTNLHQTNDGSYPDNDTENKAKENTITEGSIPSTPDNIDPINPILPSEDSPNIIVPDINIDTGLGAVYVPTIEQLNSFSQWLWSPNFIEQIKKLFSDPMQGIIGLHQIYFTPEHNGTNTIHCGYLDSGVSSDYTKKRYVKINCGSVNVKETFGNIFDYEPLTTIECYLPFIGIVPLKVGDVMRSTINIEYICDVLTGACLCNIYVLRDDIKALLYTYGGNCAVNYPLSSGSYMGIVSSLVGVTMSIATGIISGGTSIPLSIGGGAMSLLNAKTNVKTSGGYSGNTGAMGVKKPYLIIKNTLTSMPDNYNKYIGNAYNDIKNISECVGYSVIENVQLIGEMTDTEKEEIKNYLESGVII